MMDVLSLVPCRNKIRLKKKSSFWYILQLGKVEKKKRKKNISRCNVLKREDGDRIRVEI